MSDHHDLLLTAEEEAELVDHGLHNVLQMGPHRLKLAQIAELVLEQGRPPADGKVLAVHTVVLAQLSHSEKRNSLSPVQEFVRAFYT